MFALGLGYVQLTARIDFDFAVGPVSKALPALSKAIGSPLVATGPVANQVVFLRVRQSTVGEVLTSLAEVTGGEWVGKGPDGRTLQTSQRALQTEQNLAKAKTRADLTQWRGRLIRALDVRYDPTTLKKLVRERAVALKRLADPKSTERERSRLFDRQEEISYQDPTYRALARCLLALDLERVLKMEPEDRLVFTLAPNRVQSKLDAHPAFMTQLVVEQRTWGQVLRALPKEAAADNDGKFPTDESIRFFEQDKHDHEMTGEPWERSLPYRHLPTSAFFVVTRSMEESFEFALELKRADGEVMVERAVSADFREGYEAESWLSTDRMAGPVPPEVEAMDWGMFGKPAPSITPLLPFIDDPVANEPLAIGNQPLLVEVGERKKRSVIACLEDDEFPDESRYDIRRFTQRKTTKITPSLILIRPKSISKTMESRFDRSAVKALFADFRKTGRWDLDWYARRVAPSRGNYLLSVLQQKVDAKKNRDGRLWITQSPSCHQFFLSLSDLQISSLKAGNSISYASLTPQQLVLAKRVVFGLPSEWAREQKEMRARLVDSTIEMPNGLNDDGGIEMKREDRYHAIFYNAKNGEYISQWPLDADPPSMRTGYWAPFPDGVLGSKASIHPYEIIELRFLMKDGPPIIASYRTPLRDAEHEPILVRTAPAEFRTRLAKAIETFGG